MFDWYEPEPSLVCPRCGKPLVGWQGKDGPCGRFIWKQGVASPIAHSVDEDCRLTHEELRNKRLRNDVTIYSYCDKHVVDALAVVHDGVWSKTEITKVRPTD